MCRGRSWHCNRTLRRRARKLAKKKSMGAEVVFASSMAGLWKGFFYSPLFFHWKSIQPSSLSLLLVLLLFLPSPSSHLYLKLSVCARNSTDRSVGKGPTTATFLAEEGGGQEEKSHRQKALSERFLRREQRRETKGFAIEDLAFFLLQFLYCTV